jgi:hemoglobin
MTTPTLYEWAGGQEAFDRLTQAFYGRVRADAVLAPVFARMPEDHPHHVALWFAEVFGGPPRYTEELGGYERMLAKHRELGIDEERRLRFVTLLSRAATLAGLPDDPEFRAAIMGYAEWGTRLAKHNSAPDAEVAPHAPVPRWGWGVAPPYRP